MYFHSQMTQQIESQLNRNAYDVVHVQLARMAPYFEGRDRYPRRLDLVDSLALNMKRRYEQDKGAAKSPPMSSGNGDCL